MPPQKDPGFDQDIVSFVVCDLRTVWALELLLTLRAAPDRVWTEMGLTRELRASLGMVSDILRRLEGLDVAACGAEGWRYRPGDPTLDDLCTRTETAYRQKPFAMISLIGRGSAALSDLANAFRFKADDR